MGTCCFFLTCELAGTLAGLPISEVVGTWLPDDRCLEEAGAWSTFFTSVDPGYFDEDCNDVSGYGRLALAEACVGREEELLETCCWSFWLTAALSELY